jgi:peptidoglycan hydrolase-like protein with peptidoglycan-binding domain
MLRGGTRLGGGLVLVMVVALAVTLLSGGDGARTAGRAAGLPLATATVERRTLTERELVDGRLGFADSRPLEHGGSGGTITWLAPEGTTVERGEPLYRVDERPVLLLYGEVPAYRALGPGARGRDVAQLERNLDALGAAPAAMTVDRRNTAATTAAVRAWQRRRGLTAYGTLGAGRIAFLPGPRRVGEHATRIGTRVGPGSPVMHTGAPRQVVTVELAASRQALVEPGDRVRVTLPGRATVGRVEQVGRVARTPGEEGPGPVREPFVEVVIAIRPDPRIRELDEAPVTVAVERVSRREVPSVPITALLAQPGGRFALERAGGGRRLVQVEIGMAADGYVEVSGPGIRPGMLVLAAE